MRITHRPSGIVVQCQNERSQSANRATAMAMLRAKLIERQERERQEEIATARGETLDVNFGSQIRSYVLHPYTMVKDHRTDFEVGNANGVLDGDLDGFVRSWLEANAQGPRLAPFSRADLYPLYSVVDAETETDLIDRALAEDVGDGDATTEATVDAAARGARDDHAEGARGDLRARRSPRPCSCGSIPTRAITRLGPGGRVARGRAGAAGRGLGARRC